MLFKDILSITLEETNKTYEQMIICFIIKDGKLKGFSREKGLLQ